MRAQLNSEVVLPQQWVNFNNSELSMEDKKTVTDGEFLTDKHINFAQTILKRQYSTISGLQSTLIIHNNPVLHKPDLQIVHVRGNHWIVSTTLGLPGGTPRVYDSLYDDIDQSTQCLLTSLYGTSIKVEEGPNQIGGSDCGLFAIATATLLANGGNPGLVTYNQSLLRNHLVKCFEDCFLTLFPQTDYYIPDPDTRTSTASFTEHVLDTPTTSTPLKEKSHPLKQLQLSPISTTQGPSTRGSSQSTRSGGSHGDTIPDPHTSTSTGAPTNIPYHDQPRYILGDMYNCNIYFN